MAVERGRGRNLLTDTVLGLGFFKRLSLCFAFLFSLDII